MPIDEGGMVRYDWEDPSDMAELIDSGLIWKGPVAARRQAVEDLTDGKYPMNDLVPPDAAKQIMEEQARRYPDGLPAEAPDGSAPAA